MSRATRAGRVAEPEVNVRDRRSWEMSCQSSRGVSAALTRSRSSCAPRGD